MEDWINEFNPELNACDIQGQRDILHQTTTLSSNIQCSQDLEIERLLGYQNFPFEIFARIYGCEILF